jgi:hypothetical protein
MDLLRVHIQDDYSLALEVSAIVVGLVIVLGVLALWRWRRRASKRFSVVSLNVALGGVGSAELRPSIEDVEVAHKIWTELVTRKAALPMDPDNDVIVEVYDSWYALFGRVRELIAQLPPALVRNDASTQELIRIATQSLNSGLRPHLTKWQARFRNWYAAQDAQLATKAPQDVQRQFPEYDELMQDLRRVNDQLIQYAGELEKIVRGK